MSAIFDFPLSSETLAEDELTAITGTPMAVLSTFFYARAHFFAQTQCRAGTLVCPPGGCVFQPRRARSISYGHRLHQHQAHHVFRRAGAQSHQLCEGLKSREGHVSRSMPRPRIAQSHPASSRHPCSPRWRDAHAPRTTERTRSDEDGECTNRKQSRWRGVRVD